MALTLISEPSEFSWSRHPLKFSASSDAAGNVRIRQELRLVSDDSIIYSTNNLSLDADGAVVFDWSRIITDQVSGEVPQLVKLGYTHIKSSLSYYIRFVEVIDGVDGATLDSSDRIAVFGSNEYYTTSYQYIAIDTGKNYLWQTSKPLSREHTIGQQDVLTALFTADQISLNLRFTINYTDNTTHIINQELPGVSKGQLITFDISDDAWDWNSYQAKEIKSIVVRFTGIIGPDITLNVVPLRRFSFNYIYSNNQGGFDVLHATGERVDLEKIEGEVYQDDQNLLRVRQDIRQDIFEQASGYLPKDERNAYKQMRDINRAFYIVNGLIVGIIIFPQETEIGRSTQNLNAFSFRWTSGHGRQNFDIINAINA